MTPAAIAQQVRKLEADIGTALVRREGRGVTLTQAGRQLSEPLHDAFTMIANGIHELQRAEASRGVRVSTTDYFASSVILPGLGDFWKRHPTLQVSFSPDGNTAPVDLENFDVVIRGDAPGRIWGAYEQVTLVETPMIVCGAPALVGSGKVDPGALPWIADRGIGGDSFDEAVRALGCDPEALHLVDPGSGKMELEAVLMGYGLIFGPELIVRSHLAEGALVRIDADPGMRGTYYAIHAKGPVPKQIRLFLDWLEEVCAPLSCD